MREFDELKQKTKEDLESLLAESREALLQLRFKAHGQELKNWSEIRKIKNKIARILTIINKH